MFKPSQFLSPSPSTCAGPLRTSFLILQSVSKHSVCCLGTSIMLRPLLYLFALIVLPGKYKQENSCCFNPLLSQQLMNCLLFTPYLCVFTPTTTTTPEPTTTTTPPPTTTPSHSICTVTGPTVIDFSSHLDSVKDRCDYYLLQIQGLSVVGYFLERRLKDVSFLDSVTLELYGTHIHLKQGGRVLVDGTPLNLDSSPQTVNGVQLSKDQTGVTAIVQIGNLKIIICFDGYTVLIFVEGSTGSSMHGLCQNSSSDANSCYHLKEAPFTSCPIDPEPYIDACTELLSIYPAVDGLKCQFMKAYAKACRLYSNITLDGWRSKTKCCKTCFTPTSKKALGDPTVCRQNSASLTLIGCLLEDKGIDYSFLHLNDPTCRGQVDEENHMVTFSFNSSNFCGSEIMSNNSHVIYKNTIVTPNNIISHHNQTHINFSCIQTLTDMDSVVHAIKSGFWNYTLTMKAYEEASCKKALDLNTKLRLNQRIWVKVDTDGLDGNRVALVIKSCWATNQASPTGSPRHDLIMDGCPNPADPTVRVESNGEGTSSYFSFSTFRFSGGSDEIYLHCKLHLSVKQENSFIPTCNGAPQRISSMFSHESDAFFRMGWTK
uniref:ZP domain-containing protein n=1 Tax=Kryptolebias marmoratus TaxID=37003 RepID=A0A3Q3BF03_KRYMA